MPVNISTMQTAGAVIVCLAGAALGPRQAHAQYRPQPSQQFELPAAEGRGCYFYRGREFCGSYCYWEVNGKRYCQRRLRDAHSQAPVLEAFDWSAGEGLLK